MTGIFFAASAISFNVALIQSAFNIQEQWENSARRAQIETLEVAKMYGTFRSTLSTPPTSSSVKLHQYVDDTLSSNNDPGPKSPYAYAFIIGGCDLEKKGYKGFLYNILVATKILREEESTADVVAYFQISYAAKAEVLPDEDTQLLAALGIRVKYIPKSEHQSFYETVMQKFRVLALTEYRKVILMDGDIMPVTNLDYLFKLSDTGVLEENVIVAGTMEPSNAGFFMITPVQGEYEHVQEIIHAREEKAAAIPDGEHKFDEEWGFGHKIVAPDYWRSRRETGTLWNFHFAFSDQGLLFHYTKYVRKSVSIVFDNNLVENWNGTEADAVLF